MNLKSCNNCGVVLDLSVMNFPTSIDDDSNDHDTNMEWNGGGYNPVAPCPVCKADIVNKDIKL